MLILKNMCRKLAVVVVAVAALSSVSVGSASAQDFFSALFGSITGNRPPPPPMMRNPFAPFEPRGDDPSASRPSRGGGGSQAYCIRTCDGRYFPLSTGEGQSRTASCADLCPASETRVMYGSTINRATAENGRAYSDLPNAFRYRNELVAGCTCNGKDPMGLAHIDVEKDPTLRRGDIVAGPNGLMVANEGGDRRGVALNLSPVSNSVRAKYERSAAEPQE